jgi:type I restriction enzyme S subunit
LELPRPEIPEQESIAAVLWKIQRAIELEEKLTAIARELKQSAMHQLFAHGLHNEQQKETDLGPKPASWIATTLGEVCADEPSRIQTGPFGSQLHAHEYLPMGIPVVNPTHLDGNKINHERVPRISPATAARLERHKLQIGDILFARRGEIGRHGLVGENEEGWLCGTGCFLVRARNAIIHNRFLSCLFSTDEAVSWLNANAAGAIMPNLNNVVLSRFPVFYPKNIDEQKEIAGTLQTIDRKISVHERKRAALSDLFQSLLHQLMTAQIRVDKLDIDTSEVTA